MKYIRILLLLLLITSCTNKEINIKDDYYEYINKDIINKKIKDNEIGYSTFTLSQEKVNNNTNKIIENIIGNKENQKERQMSSLYNLVMNKEVRNKIDINPLKKYLNKIDSSNNISEFINNSIDIEKDLNIDIFTNLTVSKDYKNNKQNIIYLYPINFDYGVSSDYYIDDNYMYYHAILKKYNIRLLKQYGYSKDKAKQISKDIDNFYIEIATNSHNKDYYNNIENYYNIKTKDDLKKIYSNIDIDNYYKKLNIPNDTTISIVDEENYKKLNELLTNNNLVTLKEYVKLKILQNYSIYASDNYSNIIYKLSNELQGINNNISEKEKALNIVKSYFSYDIDKIYTDKYLSKEEYNDVKNIIDDILSYYKENINNNKFLSNSTKNKAKIKINNIKVNIGLNTDYINYTDNYSIDTNKSLIENIINIKSIQSNYLLNRLKDNKETTSVSQTMINAYYNPQNNSINFPTALLSLYSKEDSYYKKLGNIGMIIAHEITHAIDPNGAKFDEYGNLNNWWNTEDYTKYNNLKSKVIKYYNKYEVLKGINLNGKLTVNENIADLGSISCITNLALNKGASNKELKELYTSFAKLWASNYQENYQNILLLEDVHSPNKYRVNATLQSNDIFYKVYKINKFNKMYIPKKKRINIW